MFLIFLLLLYSFLVYFAIHYLLRKEKLRLSKLQLGIAIVTKIGFGCAYGYLFKNYYSGDDTWMLHQWSQNETSLLLSDPFTFFQEFSPLSAFSYGGYSFRTVVLYLNDLEYCLIAKVFGILNLLTTGNYYVNICFLSFISFWGHYWMYKFFVGKFPQARRILLLLIFFFPPALFWLSGLRADAYLFFFFCLLMSQFDHWIDSGKKMSLIWVFVALLGLAIFRTPLLILLVPALIAWGIGAKYKRSVGIIFAATYAVSLFIFWLSKLFPSYLNMPLAIAQKQHEFAKLEGTRLPLANLYDTPLSFLTIFPQAFSNTFLRPFPWEAEGILQIVAALETALVALALLWAIVQLRVRSVINPRPEIAAILAFSISLYLLIGYTVPFPGAIVRYKAIPELFLLAVAAVNMQRSVAMNYKKS